MVSVKGYSNLTNEQKDLFDSVYKNHIMAMKAEMRKRYSEQHLEKVKADKGGIKVYFDNGEWFKYLKDGTWS